MIVKILKTKKETPRLTGHRLFKKDRIFLKRIAKKERDEHGRVNESHAVRVAIREKHNRLFPEIDSRG